METIYSLDTTIFAWSTAAEHGSRAILRISGPETFTALNRIILIDEGGFDPVRCARCVVPSALFLGEGLSVRGWLWSFPGPNSYTGQDMIEFHTVSAPALLRMIDQKLLQLQMGLEPARTGEFTARAFLLGRMDLTQAQAVGQLVEAQNDAQIQAAMNMLQGNLHRSLTEAYQSLSELAVSLETQIDFSEEEIEVISRDRLADELARIEEQIGGLLRQAIDVRSIRTLPRVFLVGSANAGKSTLLNRLSGLDRAICSPLAGTTRDILTAIWKHGDREVLLCDMPGMMAEPEDRLTHSAIERSRQFPDQADLVLWVVDAWQGIEDRLQPLEMSAVNKDKTIVVLNKIDLAKGKEPAEQAALLERFFENRPIPILAVSALTGKGLDELTGEVFRRLSTVSLTTGANQVALDLRGRTILEQTLVCVRQAGSDVGRLMRGDRFPGLETVAAEVRQALGALGALLGKDVTEDVLTTIFSRFCIGK